MRAMPDALLPWQIVRVSGPSMAPGLRTGDRLVVRRGARIRPGDVVLARFADVPDTWVLKRAARPAGPPLDAQWIVQSDNPFAGGDSSVHGPARVSGRAVLLLRAGRRVPQRVPPRPAS
ncbi:MAG: Peptidase superoxide dismutase maturation protease, nickel-type [Pseudonocardiales bacterium]|nr:Peptidase superoxide dismutase maturation protease, nickel-type [Jatrophihabitantaceae bacterium]MCW2602558.1 Peptidase superoxide dismutase maturation protease, nickel-type [Pseudonocardiales bacterium]